MEIVNKQINELKPFKKNPKKHPEKQLAMLKKSMREFGWTNPILVSGDNMIIAGHARYQAAQELGFTEVPTISIDLPYEKAVAYVLADNKLAELAEDDEELMRELLAEVVEIPYFDIESIGFDDSEVEELLNSVAGGEVKEDDFNPDSVTESICQVGDIWQLGRHRVMCGDSTVKGDVERLLGGINIDLLLTDPPYGVDVVKGESSGKIGGGGSTKFGKIGGGHIVQSKTYKKIKGDETTNTAKLANAVCDEIGIKNKIIWGGNYFTDFLDPSPCWIVWDKENTGNFADAEMAWTSFDKGIKLYHWLWNGLSRKGDRTSELVSRVHPTQKPVGLHGDILKDFSNDGENILDLFLGSGTTLIACEQLNRVCCGIEYEKEYCDVIIKRWEEFTGQKAEKVN